MNFSKKFVNGVMVETISRDMDNLRAIEAGAQKIKQVSDHWKNTTIEQQAGRIAEEWHATTFNQNAASMGLKNLKATTTASLGAGTAPADIIINNGSEVISQAQIKYNNTPTSTSYRLANTKYDGLQRVGPADQITDVRNFAATRGANKNYPDVAKNASDRIISGAKSKPLTRNEAIELAKTPDSIIQKLQTQQIVNTIATATVTSAVVGGGISAFSNVIDYANNKKSAEDAFFDTVKDTATSGVRGAAVSGTSIMAKTVLTRAGAQTIAGSSAPIAIGITAVQIAIDAGSFINGDIDGKEFAIRSGKTVVKGGLIWVGMEAGAAIGTLVRPGIGTIVGGLVGSIGASILGSILLD